MEQQRGDCALVFPHQGPSDGHAFVFQTPINLEKTFFHIGEGFDGEVNKLSSDGLDVGDQLELISQFCKNPNLKHLRVDLWRKYNPDVYLDYVLLQWTMLMRELQSSATLEYIEILAYSTIFPGKNGDPFFKAMVEMLRTNSSLLGFKLELFAPVVMDLELFMKATSTHKTLQLLDLTFSGSIVEMEAFNLLMASLTPDSIGYQSNMALRALFVNSILQDLGVTAIDFNCKYLMEAFLNMLETNKTLTTIQIPNFFTSPNNIVKVFYALEVNQSIRNIFLGVQQWDRGLHTIW